MTFKITPLVTRMVFCKLNYFIAKGWMIPCALRELVLDEDLNENHVKVTIYATTKSQIVWIWIYDH
jgi:hypothetical protein